MIFSGSVYRVLKLYSYTIVSCKAEPLLLDCLFLYFSFYDSGYIWFRIGINGGLL